MRSDIGGTGGIEDPGAGSASMLVPAIIIRGAIAIIAAIDLAACVLTGIADALRTGAMETQTIMAA